MSLATEKNVIITRKSRENIVKARAGVIELPKIAGMAFGNGGTDENGNAYPLSKTISFGISVTL